MGKRQFLEKTDKKILVKMSNELEMNLKKQILKEELVNKLYPFTKKKY